MSSSPINEADIPLVLIPLREGYLPYPSVEVRETGGSVAENHHNDNGGPGRSKSPAAAGHCGRRHESNTTWTVDAT